MFKETIIKTADKILVKKNHPIKPWISAKLVEQIEAMKKESIKIEKQKRIEENTKKTEKCGKQGN